MMSCDTSNHKHVKQLQILMRYFQMYDLENRVKNKFLTFVEISGETADLISMHVLKATANYDSETKIIGLSADTANKNIGGLLKRRKENVFTKIKS
jgi:hypothetical protein